MNNQEQKQKVEITEGLIRYYANKNGISYEQAEYELNNTFGYEDEEEQQKAIEDISIFEFTPYNTCPINPFKYDFNQVSIFEAA